MAVQTQDSRALSTGIANIAVSAAAALDIYNARSVKLAEATRVKLFLPGLGSDGLSSLGGDLEKLSCRQTSDTSSKAKRKIAKMQALVQSVFPDSVSGGGGPGFDAELVVVLEDLMADGNDDDSAAVEGDEGEECAEPGWPGPGRSKSDLRGVDGGPEGSDKVKAPSGSGSRKRPPESGRRGVSGSDSAAVDGPQGAVSSPSRSGAPRVPQLPVWRRLSQQPDRSNGGLSARERVNSMCQPKVLRAVPGRTISLGLGEGDGEPVNVFSSSAAQQQGGGGGHSSTGHHPHQQQVLYPHQQQQQQLQTLQQQQVVCWSPSHGPGYYQEAPSEFIRMWPGTGNVTSRLNQDPTGGYGSDRYLGSSSGPSSLRRPSRTEGQGTAAAATTTASTAVSMAAVGGAGPGKIIMPFTNKVKISGTSPVIAPPPGPRPGSMQQRKAGVSPASCRPPPPSSLNASPLASPGVSMTPGSGISKGNAAAASVMSMQQHMNSPSSAPSFTGPLSPGAAAAVAAAASASGKQQHQQLYSKIDKLRLTMAEWGFSNSDVPTWPEMELAANTNGNGNGNGHATRSCTPPTQFRAGSNGPAPLSPNSSGMNINGTHPTAMATRSSFHNLTSNSAGSTVVGGLGSTTAAGAYLHNLSSSLSLSTGVTPGQTYPVPFTSSNGAAKPLTGSAYGTAQGNAASAGAGGISGGASSNLGSGAYGLGRRGSVSSSLSLLPGTSIAGPFPPPPLLVTGNPDLAAGNSMGDPSTTPTASSGRSNGSAVGGGGGGAFVASPSPRRTPPLHPGTAAAAAAVLASTGSSAVGGGGSLLQGQFSSGSVSFPAPDSGTGAAFGSFQGRYSSADGECGPTPPSMPPPEDPRRVSPGRRTISQRTSSGSGGGGGGSVHSSNGSDFGSASVTASSQLAGGGPGGGLSNAASNSMSAGQGPDRTMSSQGAVSSYAIGSGSGAVPRSGASMQYATFLFQAGSVPKPSSLPNLPASSAPALGSIWTCREAGGPAAPHYPILR